MSNSTEEAFKFGYLIYLVIAGVFALIAFEFYKSTINSGKKAYLEVECDNDASTYKIVSKEREKWIEKCIELGGSDALLQELKK